MEFKNVILDDVAEVKSGKRLPKGRELQSIENSHPYVRIRDMYKNKYLNIDKEIMYLPDDIYPSISKYIVNTDDVILANVGNTIGLVAKIGPTLNKANLTENCVKFVNLNGITSDFLYYYLKSNIGQNEIEKGIVGSSQPKLPLYNIKKFSIDLPNIDDQNKISKLLSDIDAKIESNIEINNNLHELEKSLYKEYFKELSDTNTQKLGELCNIKYGKGLPTNKIAKVGYPVYGGNGIIGYYHEFMYNTSQVLISCRGAASGNVVVSKPNSFVTNNSLILECERKYHHYLKQYSLDNYYYEYTTGSAQPQITIDNIKDILIKVPDDEILESFNKQMEVLESECFSNLEEISKLEQLRDTLLPKLMNGEIDLDNIEI